MGHCKDKVFHRSLKDGCRLPHSDWVHFTCQIHGLGVQGLGVSVLRETLAAACKNQGALARRLAGTIYRCP